MKMQIINILNLNICKKLQKLKNKYEFTNMLQLIKKKAVSQDEL